MDKKEEISSLYKLLYDKDREFEKAKGKRTLITLLGFTAFYFWIITAIRGFELSIDLLIYLVIAIIISWFHFWVNGTIFGYLANKGRDEADALERIRKGIRELEK